MSSVGALAVLGKLTGWVQEQPGSSLHVAPGPGRPGLCLPWEALSKQEGFVSLCAPLCVPRVPAAAASPAGLIPVPP